MSKILITSDCHFNHENILSYETKLFNNGIVYFESDYPNILFAKDGEIYNILGKKVLVRGGAFSVNKDLMLEHDFIEIYDAGQAVYTWIK